MSLPATISQTNFQFPGQTNSYQGKVRDVYYFNGKMAMVVSDRISAFDIIMPRAIPYKGQVLNKIAARNFQDLKNVVPSWLRAVPDPNVSFGIQCEPIPIEMVIRGHLAGHAWREYANGKRVLCGEKMPDNMVESQEFPEPIITPATKAQNGHDMDISRDEIIAREILEEKIYKKLEGYTRELFRLGSEKAREKKLILVDTKYEFGFHKGEILLIDEVHTPDSSRYYYSDSYEENLETGQKQKQLSKEFLREWLMQKGFQGLEGQKIPEFSDEKVMEISHRYVELYETLMGEKFIPDISDDPRGRVEKNILEFL
jgi:phosphoribosylaminoimidazole-succinocarboxamide synthase